MAIAVSAGYMRPSCWRDGRRKRRVVRRICYDPSVTLTRQDGPRYWVRMVAGVIAAWAILIGLILLELFPYRPRTSREWVALLVGGPPAYVGIAWLGERVLGPRLPRFSPKRFSLGWFAMMAIAIVIGSALLAVSVWISLRFGR